MIKTTLRLCASAIAILAISLSCTTTEHVVPASPDKATAEVNIGSIHAKDVLISIAAFGGSDSLVQSVDTTTLSIIPSEIREDCFGVYFKLNSALGTYNVLHSYIQIGKDGGIVKNFTVTFSHVSADDKYDFQDLSKFSGVRVVRNSSGEALAGTVFEGGIQGITTIADGKQGFDWTKCFFLKKKECEEGDVLCAIACSIHPCFVAYLVACAIDKANGVMY